MNTQLRARPTGAYLIGYRLSWWERIKAFFTGWVEPKRVDFKQ